MSNVDEIYQDVSDLFEFLRCQEKLEFLKFVDNSFRKLLLISAASYFERQLSDSVIQLAENVTSNDHVLVNLIKRTAVERQYHTWFAWDARNANRFFSIFGDNFKAFAQKKISEDESMNTSIVDFLEIGRERNRIVHEDFSSFFMEKTFEEINNLYLSAKIFVDWFPGVMEEFLSRPE